MSKPLLRSDVPSSDNESDDDENDDGEIDVDNWDFLSPDSVVAVAPDDEDDGDNDQDPIWLIKIVENNCVSDSLEVDSYGNQILARTRFLKGRFLEKQYDEKKYILFKLSNRITFFYKDVIIYPFVFVENCKKGLKVSAAHHNDIVIYAKKTGYRRLSRMNLRGSKK